MCSKGLAGCRIGSPGIAASFCICSRGIIGRKLSRKLIHITSAPLFLICWPLYSDAPTARVVASLPPLANSIRLLNAGLGKVENQDAVQAISRQVLTEPQP